jgi:hypothetical protein
VNNVDTVHWFAMTSSDKRRLLPIQFLAKFVLSNCYIRPYLLPTSFFRPCRPLMGRLILLTSCVQEKIAPSVLFGRRKLAFAVVASIGRVSHPD